MKTIAEVVATMPELTIENCGDYKDQAANTSGYLELHAPEHLIQDMPCGYNCPREFWRWYSAQA
jgi:hypothetical protein